MRLARFDGGKTGLVVGAESAVAIVDVAACLHVLDGTAGRALAAALPGDGSGSWVPLIDAWDEAGGGLRTLEELAARGDAKVAARPLADVALEAPLPSRERRIWSLGANTVEHSRLATKRLFGREQTDDEILAPKRAGIYPIGFNVYPDSVVGPDVMVTPPAFAKKIDYEGECAVVLRLGARRLSYWGYTGWNDLGIRDTHLGLMPTPPSIGYSFNLQKNFDGANVCGPWLVVDEPFDVQKLDCQVLVNGEIRQDWNTSEMIYSFDDALEHIARYMTLKSGDILTSGTGAGVAMEGPLESPLWLKGGDVVEVRLEGVGGLTTTIGPWAAA